MPTFLSFFFFQKLIAILNRFLCFFARAEAIAFVIDLIAHRCCSYKLDTTLFDRLCSISCDGAHRTIRNSEKVYTKMIKSLWLVILTASINGFNIEPRILNGIVSNTAEFRFFAHITHAKSRCSAVLISDK